MIRAAFVSVMSRVRARALGLALYAGSTPKAMLETLSAQACAVLVSGGGASTS
jgi:6-phosphogluconolactonase/glucosamine-6-phosphate isomerase/deaminase